MDKKSIEQIVSKIIEMDRNMEQELLEIEEEIKVREKQLKSLVEDLKQDSDQLKIKQGKALYADTMEKAKREEAKIRKSGMEIMDKMEMIVDQKAETILRKAIRKTSLGTWEEK